MIVENISRIYDIDFVSFVPHFTTLQVYFKPLDTTRYIRNEGEESEFNNIIFTLESSHNSIEESTTLENIPFF